MLEMLLNWISYVQMLEMLLNWISSLRPQFGEPDSWFLLCDNALMYSAMIVKCFCGSAIHLIYFSSCQLPFPVS